VSFSFIPFSGDPVAGPDDLLLIYDSKVLLDAARPYGTIPAVLYNQAFTSPQVFFGPKTPFTVTGGAEYSVSFNAVCRKGVPGFVAKMEVYVVGPAMPSTSQLGELLATYELGTDSVYRIFETDTFNFTAQHSDNLYLRFVVYGGQWHISDVSFKPAFEYGFTPDSVNFLIPVNGRKSELLQFRTELYDVNNTLVPVVIETPPVFFDGGNAMIKGPGNRMDGELVISPSGSAGATITTRGYYDKTGVFQPGSTAIFIGAGVHASASTPFLVASSSNGPVFSLGDRLIAENSGSGAGKKFVVTVSGTLLVQDVSTGRFIDVRTLVSSASSVSSLYAIETATNALVSSSLNLAFSSSFLSSSQAATSSSLAQGFVATSASLASTTISTSASLAQNLVLTSASLAGTVLELSQSFVQLNLSNSGSIAVQLAAMSQSLATQDAINLTSLTSSIINASASLSSAASAASASLATAIIAQSASLAQYIVATDVVDSVNKIKLPTSVKVQDGLYLESSSMGFYNLAQAQYPVVINAAGQFRFADSSSYVGGADPYTNVVGFANGSFLVRTPKLLLQTPNLQLIGNDTASASANVLKMGPGAANITFVSGAGFYGDGQGNLRVGSDTSGSEYLQFGPSSGLTFKARRILLDAGGAYLLADTSSVSSAHQFKIGVNAAGLSLTSGSGFYADGAGNLRVGDPTANFIEFTPANALRITTQKLVMDAGGLYMLAHPASGSTNVLKIGVNAAGKTLSSGSGFYADGAGNFTVGDPANSVVEFVPGNSLRINTQKLSIDAGGIAVVAHPTSGSFNVIKLGTNAATITTTDKQGFYVDGVGNFRAGTDATGSNYLQYMVGGFLVARTQNMLLDGGGVYILGNSGSVGISNVIKVGSLGASMSLANGVGFYADGGGNFRVGDPTTNFMEFTTTNAFRLTTTKMVVNAGGLYMLAHPASGSTNAFKLGTNAAGLTGLSGSGFYVDGSGVMRVGKGVGAGDYLLYDGAGLYVSASNFFLNAGTSGSALQLNQFNLVIGNTTTPGTWPFPQNSSTFKGFYANNAGQFFVGSAYGNYIQFGGEVIEMKSSAFVLNTPGAYFTSSVSGTLTLGTNPSAISSGTGTGIFMDGTGVFRVGNPSGQFVSWDGATLTVNGTINVVGGNAATTTYVNTQDTSYSASLVSYTNLQDLAYSSSLNSDYRSKDTALSGSVVTDTNTKVTTLSGSVVVDTNTKVTTLSGSVVTDTNAKVTSLSGSVSTDSTNKVTAASSSFASVTYTDIAGKIIKTPAPTGQGLFLGSTALGYYSSSAFKTYMDNTGNFFLTGSAGDFLVWNGSVLTINGAINITGGNAATTTFVLATTSSLSGSVASYVNAQDIAYSSSLNSDYRTKDTALSGSVVVDTNAKVISLSGSVTTYVNTQDQAYSSSLNSDYRSKDTALSGSVAATTFTDISGSIIKAPNPAGVGLYLGASFLGYYSASAWTSYIANNGNFQFKGDASNIISWNGSTLSVKAQSFTLSTSTVKVDSTVNNGTIALFNASSFTAGNGIWMDGTGNFRVGDPAGQRLSYDSTLLTVSSSAFDLRSSNTAISSVNGGSIMLTGATSTATHFFQGGSGAYDIFSGSFGTIYFSLNTLQGGALSVVRVIGGLETDYMATPNWYVRNGGSLTNAWQLSTAGTLTSLLGGSVITTGAMSASQGLWSPTASISTVQITGTSLDLIRRGVTAYSLTGSAAFEAHLRPIHSSSRFVLPVGTNLYATR
jgi:hypothetical protein